MLLGIAGVFFNWVVIKTVFEFSTFFGTSAGMLTAWGVVRDIANIGLLFGFIFMGVLLILNVEGGHGGHGGGISAKKAIPRLIIFAVLLNFSLFASQAVIDVSNGLASSFTTLAGQACSETAGNDACSREGIAGRVQAMAGMGTVWDQGLWKNGGADFVLLTCLSIFIIITAIVLFAAGIMLVIRVVVLSLLMVTSPIGFAGMAVPGLGGLAKKWWSTLISQSFFAPVFLLLIFISLKLSETLNPNGDPLVKAFSGADVNGIAGDMQVIVVFAIVIGFMIASLIAASKMGAVGASFAANTASAIVLGGLARGTNLAVGGVGAGVSRLSRAGLRPGQTAGKGRLYMESLGNAFQKSNLDLRRAPGTSALLGAAGITAGAKPSEHTSFADTQHRFEEIRSGAGSQKILDDAAERVKTKQLEAAAHHDGGLDEVPPDPTHTPAQAAQRQKENEEREKNRQFLAGLSTKELEAMHGIQEGVEQLAKHLSPEQFNKLMDSDKLTSSQKGKLKAGRFKALNGDLALADNASAPQADRDAAAERVKSTIGAMTKKDLENIPPSVLANARVLDALGDKQRDDLGGSEKRTISERNAVKGSYKHARLNQAFKSGGAAAFATAGGLSGLNADQVTKLDRDVLVDPNIAKDLTPAMLTKLARENKLSAADMRIVGSILRSGTATNPRMTSYLSGPSGDVWQ